MESSLTRRCITEFVGTFILLFIGTGAVVVDASKPGNIGHLGIALSFGLVVMVVIYAIGECSGAHINPAVSIALVAASKFPLRDLGPYVVSQCAGALAGSYCVKLLLGDAGRLGATTYTCPTTTAIGIEFLLTLILMFVILGVADRAKDSSITLGLAVGATIALEAMVCGPITGASMNPARSLGPAVVGQDLGHIWIYLVAPPIGAIAGVVAYRLTSGAERDARV